MTSFESTSLWLRTLALRANDEFAQEREKLRVAFYAFRDRARDLAAEIARDLPDHTVHDITHLDALWQMADLILGEEYQLTPTEAFVLGGAFLIHDLGNGLAAYPEGIKSIYETPAWNDALSLILRKELGRSPTPKELQNFSDSTKKTATGQVLRTLHAERAERLALAAWKDPNSGNQRFLMEDEFLRDTYGRLIGRIAHSHWWSIEKLKPEFEAIIGAPVGAPPAWTVDSLKIACALRVADAAHLDARRAPAFLMAIRRPAGKSLEHWTFQEKLQQPIRNGDRLIYTSAQAFPHIQAPAWWLCFDALQMLDKELVGADAMLADCSRPRFAVHGVQGAEDAPRLSRWVKTEGWVPVDTRIRVTDVAELASRLGGTQLYGGDNLVPLRELIQNAGDAIRARRYLENRTPDYGDITVCLGHDDEGHWIEVADNGIGMSETVMTGPMLDFGSSFWNSERMTQELPGLAASGFESTGKYGIGFFSLFMWGNHVRVTSRRYRDAVRDTRVLEFTKGLRTRPILRRAENQECLAEGGTQVRVWLGRPPEEEGGVLFRPGHDRKRAEEICEWLCPAVDSNIYLKRGGSKKSIVVRCSDWKTMDGAMLLQRLADDTSSQSPWMRQELDRLILLTAPNLETLLDPCGNVVGRAAIVPSDLYIELGAVTDGGLRVCGLRRIAGILHGSAVKASRDVAIPIVTQATLANWAEHQAVLVTTTDADESDRARAADTILRCGGEVKTLPIAESARGWLSIEDVRNWQPLPDEIVIVDEEDVSMISSDIGPLKLSPDVLVCEQQVASLIPWDTEMEWPEPRASERGPFRNRSAQSTIARLLANRWSATLDEVLASSTLWNNQNYNHAPVGTVEGITIERAVNTLRNPHRKKTTVGDLLPRKL